MPKSKAGRHSAQIQQVLVVAMLLEAHFIGRLLAQRILDRPPGLVLRVLCIDQTRIGSGDQNDRIALFARSGAAKECHLLLRTERAPIGVAAYFGFQTVPLADATWMRFDRRTAGEERPGRVGDVCVGRK